MSRSPEEDGRVSPKKEAGHGADRLEPPGRVLNDEASEVNGRDENDRPHHCFLLRLNAGAGRGLDV